MTSVIQKNGSIYTGTFSNDLLHGIGEIITKNGIKYNGVFIHGKKHGPFTVTDLYKKQFCTILYEYDVYVHDYFYKL